MTSATIERRTKVRRSLAGLSALALLSACASAPAPEAPEPSSPSAPSTPSPSPGVTPPSAPSPAPGAFTPDAMLKICPQITATNAPTIDVDRNIVGFKPYVRINGVRIAVAPTNGGCLTSGFGQRGGGLHKGIDFQTKPASMIHAAAAGRVREAGFRADYGNYVVIDHGKGVFTRYAHLQAIEPGVAEGADLAFGAKLGVMGATAAYVIPIHLHYELLTGNYETAKKSFGLDAVNIFSQTMVAN